MDLNSLRIAVVGTGANGASIASDMVRAGFDVTLIEQWPAHVEAMRTNGLIVKLPDETQVTPVRVHHVCEVAELREPFDIVYTSVKSYDTRWVCELMKPLMTPESVMVGLQNGMTIDAVAEILGEQRTVGAVLGIAANMYEPGIVVRQVPPVGTWFSVGTVTGEHTQRLAQVQEALSVSGAVEVSDDIRSSKWMKLIANIPEMLPSAIVGTPLLTAVELVGMRAAMNAAAREAYQVAKRMGISMRPIFGKSAADVPDSDQYAVDLLDAVLEKYSLPDTRVAVLQDWDKGRRAELDAFNGYVVEKARGLGCDVPTNMMFLNLAERIERGELQPSVGLAERVAAVAGTYSS